MRKSPVFLAFAAIFVLIAGMAFGAAGGKKPTYESDSSANGGLSIANPLGGAPLLEAGNSTSDSSTSSDGNDPMEPSTANSSAHPLSVLGMAIGPTADCSSTGTANGGVVKDSDGEVLLNQPLPTGGNVEVLSANCDTRAVKDNNGHAKSSTAIANANLGDPANLDGDTTLGLLNSSSSSQTTSGSSKGSGEFTAAQVSSPVASATVIHCKSQTVANNGSPGGTTSSSGTLLNAQAPAAGVDQSVEGDCGDPSGTGLIDSVAGSDAVHSHG